MKEIALKGKNGANRSILVDDEDYSRLKDMPIYYNPKRGYAFIIYTSNGVRRSWDIHQKIMPKVKGKFIDHIDRNKLNNTKGNLRHVTPSENSYNVGLRKDNSTGYRGVHFFKRTGAYTAYINANGKRINLGYFKTPQGAAVARDEAAKRYHGEYAVMSGVI